MNNTCLNIAAVLLLACTFSGCGISETDANSSKDTAFSNGFYETDADRYSYLTDEGFLKLLDFETMHQALLCTKPNCSHSDDNCIMQRLNDFAPVFRGHSMYYFYDDESEIVLNESGETELKLGTTLYRYDLENGTESKILHLDGCTVADSRGGLLLDSDTLYFVGNYLSRYYDENGAIIGYGNAGGECHLYAANLTSAEVQDFGALFDINALSEYYPQVPNSGEAVIRGFWNHKIYFNIAFVEETTESNVVYREYVIYFDPTDGTYHDVPKDYSNIDFESVRYCSEDYLVICKESKASVYKKGQKQPFILEDACFNLDSFPSVFDDKLFCGEKVFDLNTKAVKELAALKNDQQPDFPKAVVAKYGDSYIISDLGMQSNFEKISAEQLLK